MRRNIFGVVGVVILAVVAILAYFGLFVVEQTQQALVTRFGQIVRPIQTPGLYYKIPFIDEVVYFDKRLLDIDSDNDLEVIASDQKRLVVDAWARYKITNPVQFFQSVRDVQNARSRLESMFDSAIRQVLGEATFVQLVRDDRADLMERITQRFNSQAQELGVDVVDVRIRRADLPEANSQAIYQRMQTERQREATEIRAQGEEQARRIRAEADRAATVIVAEAQEESERTRGEGEGKRNEIFAEAFGADPDFFAFYRSMQAYQQGLGNGSDTRLVISPDSEFFSFFNSPGQSMVSPEPVSVDPADVDQPTEEPSETEADALPEADGDPVPPESEAATETPDESAAVDPVETPEAAPTEVAQDTDTGTPASTTDDDTAVTLE